MKKVAAKNVTVGMHFDVIHSFSGYEPGDIHIGETKSYSPPAGCVIEVIKSPYKHDGSQRIDWKVVGSPEVWSSFWSSFKTGTNVVFPHTP